MIGIQATILSAVVTGLTFPALLRSRFTLYRSLGPAESDEVDELSLKMDQIYQDLQRALYYEVNLQLTEERQRLSQQIRQSFSARELADYLADFIAHERLPAEKQKHQRSLDKILAIEDGKTRHRQLANLLLELKTTAQIKAALQRKSLTASNE